MSWDPSRQRVAKLVGTKLDGSEVEAHAPNEIYMNRFRLRCECGSEFFALTQRIYERIRHRGRLVCQSCAAPQAAEREAPARGTSKRCEHGFLLGSDCQECHPELMCCAICAGEHESKLCPETKVGRSRAALLREQRKRDCRNAAHRELRKAKVRACDIACHTPSASEGRSEA